MTAKDIVLLHARLWKEMYGTHLPIPWSKSTAQVKRLLALYEPDQLAAYISYYYLNYRSAFASRAAHSLGAFIAELPAVIASYQEEERKRGAAGASEDNARRLELARGNGE